MNTLVNFCIECNITIFGTMHHIYWSFIVLGPWGRHQIDRVQTFVLSVEQAEGSSSRDYEHSGGNS